MFLFVYYFFLYPSSSEFILDDLIMESPEDARRFPREISELHKDIISFLHIQVMTIDFSQYREFFVESVSIVFEEIGVEDGASFFYKI